MISKIWLIIIFEICENFKKVITDSLEESSDEQSFWNTANRPRDTVVPLVPDAGRSGVAGICFVFYGNYFKFGKLSWIDNKNDEYTYDMIKNTYQVEIVEGIKKVRPLDGRRGEGRERRGRWAYLRTEDGCFKPMKQ